MERMTRRRQKAVEETSDMITEAEKAVAIYEHTKVTHYCCKQADLHPEKG